MKEPHAYAKVISEILPDAMQIADRFHLHQNLLEAVRKCVSNNLPQTIRLNLLGTGEGDLDIPEKNNLKKNGRKIFELTKKDIVQNFYSVKIPVEKMAEDFEKKLVLYEVKGEFVYSIFDKANKPYFMEFSTDKIDMEEFILSCIRNSKTKLDI